jgi:phage tail protein X
MDSRLCCYPAPEGAIVKVIANIVKANIGIAKEDRFLAAAIAKRCTSNSQRKKTAGPEVRL